MVAKNIIKSVCPPSCARPKIFQCDANIIVWMCVTHTVSALMCDSCVSIFAASYRYFESRWHILPSFRGKLGSKKSRKIVYPHGHVVTNSNWRKGRLQWYVTKARDVGITMISMFGCSVFCVNKSAPRGYLCTWYSNVSIFRVVTLGSCHFCRY